MPNTFVNPVLVSQYALVDWENQLSFFKSINREFDGEFARPGNKGGYTFDVRVPNRFRGREGDAAQPEDIQETTVQIRVNRLWGADMEVSDRDLTMQVDRFRERHVTPAADSIAQQVDSEGCDLYKNVYNYVGTPGTLPTALSTYLAAKTALEHSGTPMSMRRAMVVNPDMEANAIDLGRQLFNPPADISGQYRDGTMGRHSGFKWSMDQNMAQHLTGTCTGSTPVVNGAGQTGNSLVTSGWTNSTLVLRQGDIIEIINVVAPCNSVNPRSYRNTGRRRTFVVTEDVTSSGGGAATIPISPAINADATSPFQTVTALPENGVEVRVWGQATIANASTVTTDQSLAFHPDAFTCVISKLERPNGLDWSEVITNTRAGLSIRLIRQFFGNSNKRLTRLDVHGGWKTIREDFACRVVG